MCTKNKNKNERQPTHQFFSFPELQYTNIYAYDMFKVSKARVTKPFFQNSLKTLQIHNPSLKASTKEDDRNSKTRKESSLAFPSFFPKSLLI